MNPSTVPTAGGEVRRAAWRSHSQETRMPVRMLIVTVVAVALSGPVRCVAQQLDSVAGERGAPTFGTISEITRVQITIDTNQGKKLFPVNEVRKVTFQGRAPRTAERRAKASSAASWRTRVPTSRKSAWPTSRGRRSCRTSSSTRGTATDVWRWLAEVIRPQPCRRFRSFVENPDNAQNFHYFAAIELLGDLAVAMSRFESGIKYYNQLSEAPWPDAKMRAAVLEGNAMVANTMYPEALAKFDTVLASGSMTRGLANRNSSPRSARRLSGGDRQTGRRDPAGHADHRREQLARQASSVCQSLQRTGNMLSAGW